MYTPRENAGVPDPLSPTQEPQGFPARPTHWPRFLWQLLVFWLVTPLLAATLIVLAIATLGRARRRVMPRLLRWWGQTILWACGVRMAVDPAVQAEFSRARRRVVVFNHASNMDLFAMPAFWAPAATCIVKREMMWVPIVGWGAMAIGFIPLHRGRRDKAVASLQRVAARLRQGELSAVIAPEGTRSPDGRLKAFKMGAFHLAAEAEAPIVAVVMHGTAELWPRRQRQCHPGTVTVRIAGEFAPLPRDATPAEFHAQADQVRAAMAQALAELASVPV